MMLAMNKACHGKLKNFKLKFIYSRILRQFTTILNANIFFIREQPPSLLYFLINLHCLRSLLLKKEFCMKDDQVKNIYAHSQHTA